MPFVAEKDFEKVKAMDMIKIFMIGYSKNRGGVETYIDNLKLNLNSSKFDIHYSMPKMMINGKVWVRPANRHHYLQYRRFWKEFYRENRFDVVYFNTCDVVSIDQLRFAKVAGIPIRIIHSHNSGNQQGIEHKLSFFHRWSEKNSRKNLHKFATHFFACSKVAGDWMFDGRKYELIQNGISLPKYTYSDEKRKACRQKLGLGDEILVGCVGRLSPQKNPFFTVEVAQELVRLDPSVKLVMIGDGELRENVEAAIKEHNLQDRVILTGAVDNVNEWMSAIDCLVMPSLFEGLPFVLVEAQAAGVPCVVSTGVSEEANLTGLVQFLSLEESKATWATKVLEAAVAPEQRKDTTQQLVDAGYSIEATANQVSEIIEKALTK